MKRKPTLLTESTVPASSVTATTPIGVGGTCGTGKRRARPAQRARKKNDALMREIEALQHDARVLRAEKAAVERRLSASMGQVSQLQQELSALVRVRAEKVDGPRSVFEIGVAMSLDMRCLERELPDFMKYALVNLLKKLRSDVAVSQLIAIVQSPLVLESEGREAGYVLHSRKMKWVQETLYNNREIRYLDEAPRWLSALWDEVMNTLKAAALAIPPGTRVRWVNQRLRPSDF